MSSLSTPGLAALVPTKGIVVNGVALRLVPKIVDHEVEIVRDEDRSSVVGRVINIASESATQLRLLSLTHLLGAQICRDEIRTEAVAWWMTLVAPGGGRA